MKNACLPGIVLVLFGCAGGKPPPESPAGTWRGEDGRLELRDGGSFRREAVDPATGRTRIDEGRWLRLGQPSDEGVLAPWDYLLVLEYSVRDKRDIAEGATLLEGQGGGAARVQESWYARIRAEVGKKTLTLWRFRGRRIEEGARVLKYERAR